MKSLVKSYTQDITYKQNAEDIQLQLNVRVVPELKFYYCTKNHLVDLSCLQMSNFPEKLKYGNLRSLMVTEHNKIRVYMGATTKSQKSTRMEYPYNKHNMVPPKYFRVTIHFCLLVSLAPLAEHIITLQLKACFLPRCPSFFVSLMYFLFKTNSSIIFHCHIV